MLRRAREDFSGFRQRIASLLEHPRHGGGIESPPQEKTVLPGSPLQISRRFSKAFSPEREGSLPLTGLEWLDHLRGQFGVDSLAREGLDDAGDTVSRTLAVDRHLRVSAIRQQAAGLQVTEDRVQCSPIDFAAEQLALKLSPAVFASGQQA